jgi:hypothetical protein
VQLICCDEPLSPWVASSHDSDGKATLMLLRLQF